MVDLTTARRSPRLPESALFRLLPAATRYVLRGDERALEAAAAALDVPAAQAVCRASTRGEHALLWLGPDERLALAPAAATATVGARLAAALEGLPHALVEVSHRQVALEISGPLALDALAAGCALDLDAVAFPIGMCTRTMLAKSEIVLWRTDRTRFHIEVWRSFAGYVCDFLAEASREFQQ